MKRVALLVLALMMALLSGCVVPEGPRPYEPQFTGGPRISFHEDSVNLGEVTPDQRVEHDFRFRNVGDAPLVIDRVLARTLEGC